MIYEYRCSGLRYDTQGECDKLLLEYEDNLQGTLYKKCPSCKTMNQLVIREVVQE